MSVLDQLKEWEAKQSKRSQDVALQESAQKLRERGNELFKKGSMREAEGLYTQSLEAFETIEALANRALVRLKLGNANGAKEDCDKVLTVNKTHVKALARRGLAWSQLGNHAAALKDLDAATQLEPLDSTLRQQRDREEAFVLSERAVSQMEEVTKDFEMSEDEATQEPARSISILKTSSNSDLSRQNLEIAKGLSERQASSLELKAPETGYAFARQWKELSGQQENRQRLLFQIMKPVNYEKCFAAALEPNILVEMLETCENQQQAIQLIEWLRPLSSFKLAKLMLPMHWKSLVY